MAIIPELCETDEIDPAEWPVIAHAEAQSMVDGGRYVTGQLHVRQNAKGVVMAYSSIKDGATTTPMGGITKTPSDEADLKLILVSAVQKLRCGPILVDFALKDLKRRAQV